MNAYPLAVLAPLLSAAPLALAHCGGTSASPGKGSDGRLQYEFRERKRGSSGSSGSSGGVSSGSSGGGDDDGGRSPAADGSASSSGGRARGRRQRRTPACVSVDGGAQCSVPSTLPCGNTTCNTSTDYCCVDTAADGGGMQSVRCAEWRLLAHRHEDRLQGGRRLRWRGRVLWNFPTLGVQGTTSCLASCTGSQNVQICPNQRRVRYGGRRGRAQEVRPADLRLADAAALRSEPRRRTRWARAPDAGGAYRRPLHRQVSRPASVGTSVVLTATRAA